MQMQMHTVQRLHSTSQWPAAQHLAVWHGVHTVLPATHKFVYEWYKPSCMHVVSIHQMATPEQGGENLDHITTYLSTTKGWKAELAKIADHIADGLPT